MSLALPQASSLLVRVRPVPPKESRPVPPRESRLALPRVRQARRVAVSCPVWPQARAGQARSVFAPVSPRVQVARVRGLQPARVSRRVPVSPRPEQAVVSRASPPALGEEWPRASVLAWPVV